MRKFFAAVILTVVSVLGASVATAQEKGDIQGYVGYQLVRVNPDISNPVFKFDRTRDSNGVNGSITGFASDSVGLTAEVGANFASGLKDASLITAMGGVTLQANNKTFQPFVRGLGGLARVNSDNELSGVLNRTDYGPAFAVGAGLDIKVGNRIALRVVQADYLQTRTFGEPQHNLRLGAGIRF